jgi:hypothetical protein
MDNGEVSRLDEVGLADPPDMFEELCALSFTGELTENERVFDT